MKKVIILGGGISGLSAAWFLQKKAEVTLLEKSPRLGGVIRSVKKDGFLFEEGPRSFLSKGKATLKLIEELGLNSQLISADKKAQKRYLYHKGRLQPLNLWFLIKSGILCYCLRDLCQSSTPSCEESIGQFFERRFGQRFVTDLIDPLVKGIFAGDPYQISQQACLPFLSDWEKKYGSLTKAFLKEPRARFTLYTLKNGMETLPKTLSQKLFIDIRLNCHIQKIAIDSDKVSVHTKERVYEADHLIAAIPSHNLRLLIPSLPLQPFFPLTTISLAFKKNIIKKKGFGYLVGSAQKEPLLGMTWDSQIFPQKNGGTSLCLMVPGHGMDCLNIAQDILRRHVGIHEDPDLIHVNQSEIPQYPVGYLSELTSLSHPRLTLLGNSYTGVGVNDCITKAFAISESHRK